MDKKLENYTEARNKNVLSKAAKSLTQGKGVFAIDDPQTIKNSSHAGGSQK